MRRWIIIGVSVLILMVGPAAQADHVNAAYTHWPLEGTVDTNGGGCAQPCIWLRIWDRTGFGSSFRTGPVANAIQAIRNALDANVQATTVAGTQYNWPGSYDEAFGFTPIGTITLIRTTAGSGGTTHMTCASVGNPEPYCNGNPNHKAKGVIKLGNSDNYMVRHELGHSLGLGHMTCGTGSIMAGAGCGLVFVAHDKDELNRSEMYGHID